MGDAKRTFVLLGFLAAAMGVYLELRYQEQQRLARWRASLVPAASVSAPAPSSSPPPAPSGR